MLFSLLFQPNLTHKLGSSQLSAGPVSAAMPVLCHLPKPQLGTRGSALDEGKKPATFQGVLGDSCTLAASKGSFLSTQEYPPAPVPPGQPAQWGGDFAGWADAVTAIFRTGSVVPIHCQHYSQPATVSAAERFPEDRLKLFIWRQRSFLEGNPVCFSK